MIYKNIKTGAIIDSPCELQGGDWELFENEVEDEFDLETIENEVEDEFDFENLKLKELQEYAEENGIDIEGAKTKKEIIEVIQTSED